MLLHKYVLNGLNSLHLMQSRMGATRRTTAAASRSTKAKQPQSQTLPQLGSTKYGRNMLQRKVESFADMVALVTPPQPARQVQSATEVMSLVHLTPLHCCRLAKHPLACSSLGCTGSFSTVAMAGVFSPELQAFSSFCLRESVCSSAS